MSEYVFHLYLLSDFFANTYESFSALTSSTRFQYFIPPWSLIYRIFYKFHRHLCHYLSYADKIKLLQRKNVSSESVLIYIADYISQLV